MERQHVFRYINMMITRHECSFVQVPAIAILKEKVVALLKASRGEWKINDKRCDLTQLEA